MTAAVAAQPSVKGVKVSSHTYKSFFFQLHFFSAPDSQWFDKGNTQKEHGKNTHQKNNFQLSGL